MIDLIIPYYNNYLGLLRTLASINLNIFEITVVDDCSAEPIETSFPIHYIRLKQNSGPGWARQIGINNTNNEYIAFIDTGDVFLSKDILEQMATTIKMNPNVNFFMWPYYMHDAPTTIYDNRMHGKVYKRSFLDKYNITFSKEGSYTNEDIGFNRLCRLILETINEDIYFINTPVIQWITDADSLTEKNNHEFLYKKQTRGLAINTIHIVEICKLDNIDPNSEIQFIATALYYWFIVTAAERPEFILDAWSGAKIFFDKYKNEIKFTSLLSGNAYVKKCLNYRKKIKFPINILRFAEDIWENEIIPKKYLT